MQKLIETKPFIITHGEGYVFKAEHLGIETCKITLIDPRDLDLLDKDRHHAVLLNLGQMSILSRWLNDLLFINNVKGV